MACKTETTVIGEIEYSATQWPAEKAMLMKLKLIKTLGPALGALAASAEKNDSGDIEALQAGLMSLFSSATPEEIVSLIKEVLTGTAREGRRMTDNSFNEFFSGDILLDAYRVFIFVLKVNFNYGNFMNGEAFRKVLDKVQQAAA